MRFWFHRLTVAVLHRCPASDYVRFCQCFLLLFLQKDSAFLQLRKRVYKGIPQRLRGDVWKLLLKVEQYTSKHLDVYEVMFFVKTHYR